MDSCQSSDRLKQYPATGKTTKPAMPTVGWIQESASDAYLEGTDRVPERGPAPPPTFQCNICTAIFSSAREVLDHLSSDHGIERPFLWLRAREPARRTTVRARLSEQDISIANAMNATIAVNGGTATDISLDDLKFKPATSLDKEIEVSLTNSSEKNAAPVVQSYKLSFRVASTDELRLVLY